MKMGKHDKPKVTEMKFSYDITSMRESFLHYRLYISFNSEYKATRLYNKIIFVALPQKNLHVKITGYNDGGLCMKQPFLIMRGKILRKGI